MPRSAAVPPGALAFLRQLARHNERAWFEANRARYEALVRDPLRALVEEMDVRLAAFAPEVTGDPRRSVFRIHRDVRFSRDKSPYKTNAGCWFYHRDAGRGASGEGSVGAGFYVHLEPGACFTAAGIWLPARPTLARLREAIAADPEGFEAVVLERGFVRRFGGLDEERMLTRLPRGYAPGHPAERWLRHTSFTVSRPLADAVATGPGLLRRLEADFRAMTPLVRWLNRAIGFRPAATRW